MQTNANYTTKGRYGIGRSNTRYRKGTAIGYIEQVHLSEEIKEWNKQKLDLIVHLEQISLIEGLELTKHIELVEVMKCVEHVQLLDGIQQEELIAATQQ